RSFFHSSVHERHGAIERYFAIFDGLQAVAVRDDGTQVILARSVGGSITRVIDDAGAPVAGSTELYGPLGSAIEAAAAPWPRGFPGALRTANGVYLLGARPYVAGLGHFGAPDPVLRDHFEENLMFDPRRVNRFAYALGNPHTFVDPTGRLALIDDVIFYAVG